MHWFSVVYWSARIALAVPMWFVSGLFLLAVETFLLVAWALRFGQIGFGRAGNWLASGSLDADNMDNRIERRLNRKTNWRDKP